MKKFTLVLVILIGGSLLFFSLPMKSVAVLTVTVLDQNNRKITTGATATYVDDDGALIVIITSKTRGSWDNNLHWWSHSKHRTSNMRPADALRAVSVRIEVNGCRKAIVPVALKRTYEPLSISPHGGGAAYYIYKFDQTVKLQCA